MSIRPSQKSTSDPAVIEFGIAAFAAHLDDASVTFPVTSEELIDELDDPDIPVDARGTSVSLSKSLESIEKDEFASEREIKSELHPIFESYRDQASTNLLTSIRGLLPF